MCLSSKGKKRGRHLYVDIQQLYCKSWEVNWPWASRLSEFSQRGMLHGTRQKAHSTGTVYSFIVYSFLIYYSTIKRHTRNNCTHARHCYAPMPQWTEIMSKESQRTAESNEWWATRSTRRTTNINEVVIQMNQRFKLCYFTAKTTKTHVFTI